MLERFIAAGSLALAFIVGLWPEEAQAEQIKLSFVSSHPVLVAEQKKLTGSLIKPSGKGPFPAIVMLHGCSGAGPWLYARAHRFVGWGYVAVITDSLAARGVQETCPDRRPGSSLQSQPKKRVQPEARVFDVIDTLSHLATLSYVDVRRIAIIGWSHGGETVLHAAREGALESAKVTPRAFVAFYPGCRMWGEIEFAAPLLVLQGDRDEASPPSMCQALVENRKRKDIHAESVLYRGVYHSFDFPGSSRSRGHYWRNEYDGAATADADRRIKQLLEKVFAQ